MCLLTSGLLQRQGHTYRMHRLVQDSARQITRAAVAAGDAGCHADDGDMERAARGVWSAWSTVYDENQTSTWQAADQLMPHMQHFTDRCALLKDQLSAGIVCSIVGGSEHGLLQSCAHHLTWHKHSLHSTTHHDHAT